MSKRQIDRFIVESMGGQATLDAAIARGKEQKVAHSKTTGSPAPSFHPLVQDVIDNFGGEYEIVEPPAPPPKKALEEQVREEWPQVKAQHDLIQKQFMDLAPLLQQIGTDSTYARNEVERIKAIIDQNFLDLGSRMDALQTELARIREHLGLPPPA